MESANTEAASKLERRIAAAAQEALARQGHVGPIDLLTGLGWVAPVNIDSWRQGRIPDLERLVPVPPDRLATALAVFRRWAEAAGLRPSEVDYVSANRDRRPLRFTADGDAATERAYRTHWTPAGLPDAKRERLIERQNKAPDLVAVLPLKEWACAGCGGTGSFLMMDDAGPLCMTCVDMDHLVFLPAGDPALTRRAKRASGLSAVVVRFSRSRKRYERQGILVEEAALEQAEQQCLSDEEARARRRDRDRERRAGEDVQFQDRLAAEIIRMFPGCPAARGAAIARHAGARGSGRVARTAAGRALDPTAITHAVVASVRHEDTAYDQLLMSGVPRADARQQVRPTIDRILDAWREGGSGES